MATMTMPLTSIDLPALWSMPIDQLRPIAAMWQSTYERTRKPEDLASFQAVQRIIDAKVERTAKV